MITRDPSDRETAPLVINFLEAVGEENVFMDSVLNEEMTEDNNRIPQPKINTASNESLRLNTSLLLSIYLCVVLLFSIR